MAQASSLLITHFSLLSLPVSLRPPDSALHLPPAAGHGLHQLPDLHLLALPGEEGGGGGLCRVQAGGRGLSPPSPLEDHLQGQGQARQARQDEDRQADSLYCTWLPLVSSIETISIGSNIF